MKSSQNAMCRLKVPSINNQKNLPPFEITFSSWTLKSVPLPNILVKRVIFPINRKFLIIQIFYNR
jgi:hypothetical protein